MTERIRVAQGDITQLTVDAIVNAANESLLGGGGVDGAIHRAAGPSLLAECRTLGGCPTGQARITSGYELSARYVIHTVGPIYRGGDSAEAALLASCYAESLKLAAESNLETIAFPSISTGVYGYPKDEACEIAITAVRSFLTENQSPQNVTFCCFSDEDFERYNTRLGKSQSDANNACNRGAMGPPLCPVCNAYALIEIRGKLQCSRCHYICETCCEGGRQ